MMRAIFSVELSGFDVTKIPLALRELPSKPLLTEGCTCLTVKHGITKYDIAKEMHKDEIHVDIRMIIKEINSL